jgi:hypothetical protein
MPTFKNWGALEKYIKAKLKPDIQYILNTDVAGTIMEKEQEHIEKDVYSRRTSGEYERRGTGGLGDMDNMVPEPYGDLGVAIVNDTPFNPYLNGTDESGGISRNEGEGLPGLVNYGNGWNGINYDYSHYDATNFIEHTKEDLKDGKAVSVAMRVGLHKMGYNIE